MQIWSLHESVGIRSVPSDMTGSDRQDVLHWSEDFPSATPFPMPQKELLGRMYDILVYMTYKYDVAGDFSLGLADVIAVNPCDWSPRPIALGQTKVCRASVCSSAIVHTGERGPCWAVKETGAFGTEMTGLDCSSVPPCFGSVLVNDSASRV